MSMIIQDRRTPEIRETPHKLVVMRDAVLSPNPHNGGPSYAGWACSDEQVSEVVEWVSSRSDARNVRVVDSDYVPKGKGHFSIYVHKSLHPYAE